MVTVLLNTYSRIFKLKECGRMHKIKRFLAICLINIIGFEIITGVVPNSVELSLQTY